MVDSTADGACDEALDCPALGFDGADCAAEVCYTAEFDLASALGEALATGPSATTESVYEASCFTGADMGETVYGWTAPADGTFCFDLTSSDYDTSLAIMDDVCASELACSEDGAGAPSYTSYTTVDLAAGESVAIIIDAWSTSSVGTYVLDITEGACSI